MEKGMNKLSEIDKSNPFTVPEDYFSRLNEQIMNCLPEKEAIEPQKVTMWDRVKPWIYMAAMFLGFFFTIQFLTKETGNHAGAGQTAINFTDDYWSTVQISEEEFYQYLEEQLVRDGYYDYIYNQFYMN
jgi:hypothetical protein